MSGERDDGNLSHHGVLLHPGQDLGPVHLGERDVQQDQIGRVMGNPIERRHAGLILLDLILVLEDGLNEEPVVRVVLYYCNDRFHASDSSD